ncbi:STAS domain-containing protein [Brachybacterium sp. YJGR34]|uniref:STAS domain-containing protein n=1 Tax=Brachybacterium sp. YJGR34 TaxID=2059911 RepID=UPI000E0C4244|nr:STAS domain-containing protein [Brachybacterium sp. YJGR34]
MTHKISVLVKADVGRDTIDLYVSGCLNSETANVLAAQISRARALDPAAPILVDLTGTQHVDPTALAQLRATVDATVVDFARKHLVDVRFVGPSGKESCAAATDAATLPLAAS